MKLNSKEIIVFTIISLLLLVFSMISPLVCDELWNFGFSYNTATGLLPYKDFNMLTLPFYQLFISAILKIFGKKMLIMNLFCSLICAFVLVKTNKPNYKNSILLAFYMTLIIQGGGALFGYNTFASLILITILYLESIDYKYKNEISGVLISMVLMTKINLGIFMLIPYFIFSKKKLKSILYLSIIPLIILIYLLATNSLMECIDYCFLGLFRFKNNFEISYGLLVLELFVIGYLIYRYIKTKDKAYIYLLIYQASLYPILDFNHFAIALIPFMYYVMYINKNKNYNQFFMGMPTVFLIMECINIFFNINMSYISAKDNFLKYKNIGFDYAYLDKVTQYISEKKDTNKIFVFSINAQASYLFKLYSGIAISKYDMILNGNMGSSEQNNINEIDDICRNNQCLFLIDEYREDTKPQLSEMHISYVLDNYKKCDYIFGFDVYCNEIKE